MSTTRGLLVFYTSLLFVAHGGLQEETVLGSGPRRLILIIAHGTQEETYGLFRGSHGKLEVI